MIILICSACKREWHAEQISAVEQVLIIGDSHFCATFGTTVQLGLVEQWPERVISSYAGCGATLNSWIEGKEVNCGYVSRLGKYEIERHKLKKNLPTLATLINKTRPTILIVQLGDNSGKYNELTDNSLDLAKIKESLKKEVQLLEPYLKDIKQCLWITPTWGCVGVYKKTATKLAAVIEGIREGLPSRCVLLDSRQSFPPTAINDHSSDCLHLKIELSKIWGEEVIRLLLVNSH